MCEKESVDLLKSEFVPSVGVCSLQKDETQGCDLYVSYSVMAAAVKRCRRGEGGETTKNDCGCSSFWWAPVCSSPGRVSTHVCSVYFRVVNKHGPVCSLHDTGA